MGGGCACESVGVGTGAGVLVACEVADGPGGCVRGGVVLTGVMVGVKLGAVVTVPVLVAVLDAVVLGVAVEDFVAVLDGVLVARRVLTGLKYGGGVDDGSDVGGARVAVTMVGAMLGAGVAVGADLEHVTSRVAERGGERVMISSFT